MGLFYLFCHFLIARLWFFPGFLYIHSREISRIIERIFAILDDYRIDKTAHVLFR